MAERVGLSQKKKKKNVGSPTKTIPLNHHK